MNNIEIRIKEIINDLKPYLLSDGGNIEFIKYENNNVYVRMQGACANCDMLDATLKDGIENMIKEEIPEVSNVINVI